MSSNRMKPKQVGRDVSNEDIAATYRELANEHIELRSGATKKAQAELANDIWSKIEARTSSTQSGATVHALNRNAAADSSGKAILSTPTKKRVLAASLAVAAAALSVFFLADGVHLLGTSSPSASLADGRVSFEVDGTTVGPEVAGQGQLIASENDTVGIRLSDKSQINLQPHTTLRVAALSDGVVITRMAQGSVDVEVIHQEHTDYQFFAGPYVVKVVGTAFRLSYEPEDQQLDLKMREGVVDVLGPDGESRTVRGGESLHLDSATGESEASKTAENDEPASTETESASGDAPSTQETGVTAARAPVADFHELAAQGEFKKIVSIAEARGITNLLSSASAGQLQELAQAARYSGRLDLAERVWTRMSSRFSSSASGKNAVFFLGRLDEQRGRFSSASRRYESYLRTSPRGVYSQEAWGRKLQLSQKSESAETTRRIAKQYLQRFPQGPYAKTARAIVTK